MSMFYNRLKESMNCFSSKNDHFGEPFEISLISESSFGVFDSEGDCHFEGESVEECIDYCKKCGYNYTFKNDFGVEELKDKLEMNSKIPSYGTFFYLDGKLAKLLSSRDDEDGGSIYELAVFDQTALDASQLDNISPDEFGKLIEYREVPERVILESDIKKVNVVKIPKFIRDLDIMY